MKIFLPILILLVLLASVWVGFWLKGRIAPSALDASSAEPGEAVAYFAGGCFWCVESDYEKLNGIKSAVSGYMGGSIENPSYKEVASGVSGHRETVKIVYDPSDVSYKTLVTYLLRKIDPTDSGGSFFDRGHQYTAAIYYLTTEEKEIAESVIKEMNEAGVFSEPLAVSIEPATEFFVAEDYHQDYYKKNPIRYDYYRKNSGRDTFIESIWGDGEHDEIFPVEFESYAWESFEMPNDDELKSMLTPLQYSVTQEDGTETPFDNEYWDNHDDGLYVDIISGEPLFSSTDKFDSGTGWPSFLRPIDKAFVTEKADYKLLIPRTEIRSKIADSHLGHIILDGPVENDRIRYCMNSASLRFIPAEELDEAGYGDFLYLFEGLNF